MTILAEGVTSADAEGFTMTATQGSLTNGILSNAYLQKGAAAGVSYDLEVDVSGGRYRYKEDLVMTMAAHGGAEMHHTDQNVLSPA